jgi:hypothetical protein
MVKGMVAAALLGAVAAGGFAPQSEWAPKEFPISFWCGPPDEFITTEQYKAVAVAGFNYLAPPCEGRASPERNRKILDTARAAGLKAFLQDERMPLAITGVADAGKRLDAIVKDYAKHPAFAGYFLTDEPSASAFPGLGEVVAYLRKKDPKHPAYINLFPNYASEQQLGTPTYEQHVEQYIKTVQPFAVSYDHYHFLKNGDRPGFFANLETVRQLAKKYDLPFWQIVLAIPHLDYRPLTEAEKRWEAMQTLAFGGKGLMYFTYWTVGEGSWGDAIIKRDGTPSRQYEEVRRINADVKAIGKYLLHAVSDAVFMNGAPAPETLPRVQGTPVIFPGGGDVTVGLFRADTHAYVLFANRDYRKETATDVLLQTAGNKPQQLNKATGKWREVKSEQTPDGDLKIRLELAPGDAELYRW